MATTSLWHIKGRLKDLIESGGYIAWHGYQSFKPNEVTPEYSAMKSA